MKLQEISLYRSSSSSRSSRKIVPTRPSYASSFQYNSIQVSNKPSSSLQYNSIHVSNNPLFQKYRVISLAWWYKTQNVVELIRSFIGIFPFSSMVPTRSWLITKPNKRLVSPKVGNVTGTLFGYKNGHVSFAVQDDGRSGPVLLLELTTSTGTLVKEMSSGQLRITLECAKRSGAGQHLNLLQVNITSHIGFRGPVLITTESSCVNIPLVSSAAYNPSQKAGVLILHKSHSRFKEPAWTMYCNGKKCGHAVARSCAESDWYLLSNIQALTADAGVIPMNKSLTRTGMNDELAYMRSRFERVIGNHNSEAFYMMNPDSTGGPELSIYLLRI
ncbi:Mizu-kussei [Thalictrum thalictroides]|uniref:Mizu-kussei n=1 Tax=Thalictrum thalictroides TaxID=46969 RepID=A0A7J6X1C4_THATH|nr:Mizu-kussei [Thalictrum thalictroides]